MAWYEIAVVVACMLVCAGVVLECIGLGLDWFLNVEGEQ